MSISIPWGPVAPPTNVKYTVSSVILFAVAVTLVDNVAVAALPVHEPELPLVLPVTLPVTFPINVLTVKFSFIIVLLLIISKLELSSPIITSPLILVITL